MNKFYNAARKVLEVAIQEASGPEYIPRSDHFKQIKTIMSGKSKTYPYIMVTAVLAKCVKPSIHPRSLQKKSSLEGAYDARGLCESVVVPTERELLTGGFGNSPSPFLNKPARYPEVSLSNPDRMRTELQNLYNFLEEIKELTAQNVFSILCDIIHVATTKKAFKNFTKYSNIKSGAADMIYFGDSVLKQSCSGQSCVLMSALSLSLIYDSLEVVTHPINQCGTSSKQILDIDLYKGKSLIGAAEVKDKIFGIEDIGRTTDKIIKAGLSSFMFLIGPNAEPKDKTIEELEKATLERNIACCFISVSSVVRQAAMFGFEPCWTRKLKKFEKQLKIDPNMTSHLESCFNNIFKRKNIVSTFNMLEIPAFDIVMKVTKE